MDRCRCKWGFLITVSTVMVLLLGTVQLLLAQNMDNRDGNREIYIMNSDGGDVQRLTNNDAQDLQPVWSPDKTRIAFVSNRDENFAIYIMNADGSNQRQISLDESAYLEYPAWSPDGHYLAYASDKAGNFDIYTIEVNGSNLQRLTTGETDETEPSWSPDGCKIAFLQQVEGAFELILINMNGGTPERLTQSNGGDYFSPRWSPDGTRLAYALTVFDRSGNSSEIYVRDMASGDESLLISRENSFVQGISWSKDGNELLYQVKEQRGNWVINVIDTSGNSFRVITDQNANSETPAWFTPPSSITVCNTEGEKNNIEVFANQERNQAGLSIRAGQVITIEYVRGSWRAGPLPTWPLVGPGGDPQVASKSVFPVPGSRIMSLVGGVDNYPPFLVGERYSYQSEVDGELWLAANDDDFTDNVGSLIVKVTIQDGRTAQTSVGTTADCSDAIPTTFSPGNIAIVDFSSTGALRILTDYSGGRTMAQLYDNNRVELLEGPVCYNSVNYWKIYYRPINAYGWIAEGRNNDRFLCPESNPECS